ncbi:MAG: PKD domain-containing protein, partial [Crocinitomicaceae bacterium]|nr:PKD domain-containing protein [Crocinitomicaceae bacterium]
MKLRLLSICTLVMLSLASFGQVTDMGGPLSWKKKDLNNNDVITQVMPGYNQTVVDKQDAIHDAAKDAPWRFGYKYSTDFNLTNSGTWTTLPNGDRVWRLGIHCPGAVSVNLLLEDFNLPEGAGLYLFDKGNTNRIGAYTSGNNNPELQLGTELIIGEHMIVEYYEPQEVQGQGQFTIAHVVHGYRSLNKIQKNLAKALNSSNDCNIDVRCPLGNGWDDQIRSVAMIVVGGNGICTGALVNTATCDYTPYFLTANHCYSGSVANWAFRFNWEVAAGDPTLSCATTTNTSTAYNNAATWDQTTNGGTVRAVYSGSDMLLVEINLSLTNAQNWGVFFAGWDNSETTPTQVTGIHHPAGDIKKICRDNTGMAQDTWNFNGDPNTRVWRVNDWEQGVTEPGSSGSPLFDQNGRVIGDLSGGSAACIGTNDNGGYDGYGRFGVSWVGGGTNGTRLSNWLDPTGTGAITNDGCDPNTPALADDAGISSITAPTGGLCTTTFTPEVVLQNFGTNTLSSVTINYDIDGGANQTFNWTGSLASAASTTVTLPNMTTTLGAHVFNASTSNPNVTTDSNPANDASASNFYIGDEDVQIDITLDCWGSETTWTLEDASNNVIASGGPYTDGTPSAVQTANLCLASGQCYDFIINDTYGDGMYGSQYGSCTVDGSYTITQTSGPTVLASIVAVNSDFGTQEINNFCVTAASPAPVANFTGAPTSICVGQSVAFQDLSSNTPTSWVWDFGDGNTSAAQNPTHVFNTSGTYTISLTATNAGGSNTYTENNYIVVNALPSVVASGATTICAGQTTVISGSGATSYSWDNGAGTNASATVSPSTTTTYTVTGTTGGCSNTDQVTVTVNAVPSVSATGAATICAGQTTIISGSGATSYSWDNGAGTNAFAAVSPTSTTTYTVTGTTNGCSATDQVTVTVNAVPSVTATGAATICAGQSTTITGSGATSYSWDNGAGTNASATVSPTSTTTYTVTGTTNGCSATDQVTVTVNALPTVTASGAATICAGQSTTITGSGATSYSWDNGAGTNASATVSPISTTTYTLTGTTSGCSATDQVTVTVNAIPSVTASGTATICAGQSTTIIGSGATSYSWDNGAGTNASATVSPASTTTYTVTGTTSGCSNTDQVTVTVEADPTIAVGTTNNPSACATSTGSIQVTGSGTGDIGWSGATTGSMIGVTLPYTITGLPAGSYTIAFSSATGCNSNIITQTLVDPSAPTVVASGTATICAGQSATITGSGATTYSWDNGAGTNASATVSPSTTTTYTVTGTTGGCS